MNENIFCNISCIYCFRNVGDMHFFETSSVCSDIFVCSMASFCPCRGHKQSETITRLATCGILTESVSFRTWECVTIFAVITLHTLWSGTLLWGIAGYYADISCQLMIFSFLSTELLWETVKLQQWQFHPCPGTFPLCTLYSQCHWAWDSHSPLPCQDHKYNLHSQSSPQFFPLPWDLTVMAAVAGQNRYVSALGTDLRKEFCHMVLGYSFDRRGHCSCKPQMPA